MGAELVLSAVNERRLGIAGRALEDGRPGRLLRAARALTAGGLVLRAARPARRPAGDHLPSVDLPGRGARLPARLGGGRPHLGARPRGRRRRRAGQQTAITSKLTLVRKGVILFSPNGSRRVLWTKMRGPPRRWTSTSAATSSGLDRVSIRGVAWIAQRSRSSGSLEPVGRRGEGDVVEADAGLLDRAVVVGADQLAVLGDAQLEDGLGRVGRAGRRRSRCRRARLRARSGRRRTKESEI